MNKTEEIIQVLETFAPMPSDDDVELTAERLNTYSDTVEKLYKELRANPERDGRLLMPLINSLGYGEGNGVYWTTLHALEKFPLARLRSALREGLEKGERGPRMWCAYMLGRIRDSNDTPILIAKLRDPEPYVRINVLDALAMIGDLSVRSLMEELLNDPEEDVRKAAREAIAALQSGLYAVR